MITNAGGFTYQEIIDRVVSYIGNTSTDFATYIEETISLAEFRFCKAHDWSFLYKQGLSLTVTNGTSEYALSVGNIGFYMPITNVETIFSPAASLTLKRLDTTQVRRLDPETDDGESTSYPQVWSEGSGENSIIIWPPTFQNDTLKIDGKISPAVPTALSERPSIPFRYQESYIEYIKAVALDRENDDRASIKKQEALALIRADIQDDMRNLGDTENARIKHWREASQDGAGTDINAILFWTDC